MLIQIAVLVVVGLEFAGIHIPILRELISIIYLIFIPGILILKILKLDDLDTIETILFSIGLSISILMFLGFLINLIYPLFGIQKPLSIIPLLTTITIFTTILWLICFNKEKNQPTKLNWRNYKKFIFPPIFLLLSLIPFLAIFGTYLMNFYNSNILLIGMLILIGIVVLLVSFDRIPKKYYTFVIFIISISLIYHKSLISMYIWGWDINLEYYLANTVIQQSYWDFNYSVSYNAMISITILAPLYHYISNIDLVWIFKIVYPFLFSIMPVGLYYLFQKMMNKKIAFLSIFFFVSIFIFHTEMLSLARQQIAELFLASLLIALVNKSVDNKNRFLLIIFSLSIIVSHYGLSYILIIIFIFYSIFYYLSNKSLESYYRYLIKLLKFIKLDINFKDNLIPSSSNKFNATFVIFL